MDFLGIIASIIVLIFLLVGGYFVYTILQRQRQFQLICSDEHLLEIREVFEEVSKDIILPLYGNLSKTQISTKSDNNDLVTEADKLGEIFIKSKLNILSENFNFIGEESYNNEIIKKIENSNSLFTWTCDPIDGTFNFANNDEKFCIMISLCKSKIPIFSWLYFPVFEIFCYSNYSEIILEHKNNKLSINRQNQKIIKVMTENLKWKKVIQKN